MSVRLAFGRRWTACPSGPGLRLAPPRWPAIAFCVAILTSSSLSALTHLLLHTRRHAFQDSPSRRKACSLCWSLGRFALSVNTTPANGHG
jgi:hypothetical protein